MLVRVNYFCLCVDDKCSQKGYQGCYCNLLRILPLHVRNPKHSITFFKVIGEFKKKEKSYTFHKNIKESKIIINILYDNICTPKWLQKKVQLVLQISRPHTKKKKSYGCRNVKRQKQIKNIFVHKAKNVLVFTILNYSHGCLK